MYDNRSRVAMNAQSSIIKDLIAAAIEKFKIDLLFHLPILNVKDKYVQQRQMLIDCAKELKRPNIVSRLKKDESYLRDLIAVVSATSI